MKKCRRLLNETKKVRMDHMTEDFYCDEVFSGKTKVNKAIETDNVLAYYHTKPFYPVHIVAVPKKHISPLITLEEHDHGLLLQ